MKLQKSPKIIPSITVKNQPRVKKKKATIKILNLGITLILLWFIIMNAKVTKQSKNVSNSFS